MDASRRVPTCWRHLSCRAALCAVGVAVVAMGLPASPALASPGPSHIFETYFGAEGSTPKNPYPLSSPTGVAVDNSGGASNGDVYVADTDNNRVEKFSPSGEFILMFGEDVDKTTGGNVCTAASHDTCQTGTAGHSPGDFEAPTFVVVDSSEGPSAGDIYVGRKGGSIVSKFDENGNLIATWGNNGPGGTANGQLTGFGQLRDITVDSSGNLFLLGGVEDQSYGPVYWYFQDGALNSSFGPPYIDDAPGFAVDDEDNLYSGLCNSCGRVGKFSDTGVPLGEPDQHGGNGEYIQGGAIDPSTNDLYVVHSSCRGFSCESTVYHFESNCDQACPALDSFGSGELSSPYEAPVGISFDAKSDDAYVANTNGGDVAVFAPVNPLLKTESVSGVTTNTVTVNGNVNPDGRGNITACSFEYGTTTEYSSGSVPCQQTTPITAGTPVSAELSGLTTNTTYHYRLAATSGHGTYFGKDREFSPSYVLDLSTDAPTNLTGTSATLNGSFNPNGEKTEYYFEWGPTTTYGNTTSLPVDAGSASGTTHVHFDLAGLSPATTYHYRIVASNSQGTSDGSDEVVTTSASVPLIRREQANQVHSESAVISAQVNPGGKPTTYHFEYGPADCSSNPCTSVPATEIEMGSGNSYLSVSVPLTGLSQGTTYHYRVVATNKLGTGGYDAVFTTYPFPKQLHETCPNALARQQTGAALLLDCRAYELVSAANAGGYDVESDLVPGETPYAGIPPPRIPPGSSTASTTAASPGTGHPTNKGVDPYIATRGKEGWSTEYVGIPANDPFASNPSPRSPPAPTRASKPSPSAAPAAARHALKAATPASRCASPSGELVQGMAPAPGFEPGPTATPDGYIAKDLSANGEHLIFGSTSKFAEGGNSNGEVSIYDRNLNTDETHVVSNTPGGERAQPLSCLQGSRRMRLPNRLQRDRRARHLREWHPHPPRPEGRRQTPTATSTGASTWTSTTRPNRSNSPPARQTASSSTA